MTITAALSLTQEQATIQLTDNQGTIRIFYGNDKTVLAPEASVYLLFQEHVLRAVGTTEDGKLTTRTAFDTLVQVTPPWDTEKNYLTARLTQTAAEAGIKLSKKATEKIPANYYNSISAYQETILLVLEKFGLALKAKEIQKPLPAKAQHRWRKELGSIEFFVDAFDSQATVVWQKRNEMLIKKGAKLREHYELNKDGSIGLDVRMSTQLRTEQADKIKNFVTSEDIILKSVNETGLLLYYGGTNGWLVFKDANGKSIDEWSVVK